MQDDGLPLWRAGAAGPAAGRNTCMQHLRLAQQHSLAAPAAPPGAAGRTRMRLADYLAYAAQQADEEPLYVFDP